MAKHFNIDKLNQQQACLTEPDLQSYVNHKANNELRFKIENHLLDCEICSDVVEGLQLIYKENNAGAYLESVKQNVKTISDTSSKTNSKFIWWSVAAVFIVGLGSYWFFTQQHTQLKQTELAQRIEEHKTTELQKNNSNSETITEEIILKDNIPSLEEKENLKKTSKVKKLEKLEPNNERIAATGRASETESVTYNAAQTRANKSIDANLTYSAPPILSDVSTKEETPKGEIILDDTEPDAKMEISAQQDKKDKTRKKSTTTKSEIRVDARDEDEVVTTTESQLQTAKQFYSNKKYEEAANLYTTIFFNTQNLEASYYAAESYYKLKNYTTAIDFCKINVAAKKEFYEEAQWLQYQILMSTNNTEKAKELLQEISKQNSKFAKQATIELQKLK